MRQTAFTLTTATIFRIFLVGIFFALLYILRDLALVILTAVVIAAAIEPATRWFVVYRVPRVIAVLLIYASLTIVVLGILYLFLPPLIDDLSGVLAILPSYVSALEGFGGDFFSGQAFGSQFSLETAVSEFRSSLAFFSGGILQTINAIFGGLLSFVLVIVISFYLAVQEHGIENFLRVIVPAQHERYVIGLWQRTQTKIGRWMQGQLLLGLIVGVLVYLGLTILGVKYALLLAVLAAVFELIPLFGPVLSAVPAVLFGFLESVPLGLMVIGLYVIIQQFENHLIYPLVVRKVIGVSPILVILALVIGGKLAGFLGLVLAVPLAAALMEFAEDIQREKAELQRKESA